MGGSPSGATHSLPLWLYLLRSGIPSEKSWNGWDGIAKRA